MSKDRITNLAILFIAILVFSISIAGIPLLQDAEAAPALAPTPVANLVGSDSAVAITFQALTPLAADTATVGYRAENSEWCDVQHIIDHGTVNTTTITTQFSNDRVNWVTGPALVTASAADGTDLTRIPLFGRYVRFNQDVSNTNPISITLLGLCK